MAVAMPLLRPVGRRAVASPGAFMVDAHHPDRSRQGLLGCAR